MAIFKLFLLKHFLRFKHNFSRPLILTFCMTLGSGCIDIYFSIKENKTNHKELMKPTI